MTLLIAISVCDERRAKTGVFSNEGNTVSFLLAALGPDCIRAHPFSLRVVSGSLVNVNDFVHLPAGEHMGSPLRVISIPRQCEVPILEDHPDRIPL